MTDLVFLIPAVIATAITVIAVFASAKYKAVGLGTLAIVTSSLALASIEFFWLENGDLGELGKMAGLLLAMALPQLLVILAFAITRRTHQSVRLVTCLAAGFLGILLYPMVALLLVCAFSGDCL